jgi:hypothetical protein
VYRKARLGRPMPQSSFGSPGFMLTLVSMFSSQAKNVGLGAAAIFQSVAVWVCYTISIGRWPSLPTSDADASLLIIVKIPHRPNTH